MLIYTNFPGLIFLKTLTFGSDHLSIILLNHFHIGLSIFSGRTTKSVSNFFFPPTLNYTYVLFRTCQVTSYLFPLHHFLSSLIPHRKPHCFSSFSSCDFKKMCRTSYQTSTPTFPSTLSPWPQNRLTLFPHSRSTESLHPCRFQKHNFLILVFFLIFIWETLF